MNEKQLNQLEFVQNLALSAFMRTRNPKWLDVVMKAIDLELEIWSKQKPEPKESDPEADDAFIAGLLETLGVGGQAPTHQAE